MSTYAIGGLVACARVHTMREGGVKLNDPKVDIRHLSIRLGALHLFLYIAEMEVREKVGFFDYQSGNI